jgi:ketosteroid isomerase-like protein
MVIAAGFILTIFAPAFAFGDTNRDKALIVKLEHDLAEAQTVDQIMPFYAAADSTVVFDGFEPGVFRGPKAIAENFAAQLAGDKSVKIDFRELTVDVDGSLGTAFSIQHAVVTMKDDSQMEIAFRETDLLRKIGGRWRIVHQHISYPADPKTGKTILNSIEK